MKNKLVRPIAVAAMAAALMTGGMSVSAANASTASESSAPAGDGSQVMATYIYGVYLSQRQCDTQGFSLQINGLIKSYQCKWDSPYWALWVTT
jgi:hypothetical protein